ncbi:hypothetical protein WA158_003668 [Blastocystis sp. Blastoise]
MKNSFLLLALLFITVSHGYLLVVGDVGYTNARILYELYHDYDTEDVNVSVYKRVDGEYIPIPEFSQVIKSERRPNIFKINTLEENTHYKISFNDDFVLFHTFSSSTDSIRMIAVSCDHTITDDDYDTWYYMKDHEEWDLMAHLGDQIYADKLGYMQNNTDHIWTYEEILEGFRDVYRYTFGHPSKQAIYRYGSHLMVPDDHEIRDNMYWGHIPKTTDVFMAAGRQAMYEYQTALYRDIEREGETGPVYFNKQIGSIYLSFMDTRFYRVFHNDTQYPLLGMDQWNYWNATWTKAAQDDSVKSVVVLTSVPLMLYNGFFAYILADIYNDDKYPPHADYMSDTLNIFNAIFGLQDKAKGFIAGDSHIYSYSQICNDKHYCIPEYVSSGMSNRSTVLPRFLPFYFYSTSLSLSTYPYQGYYHYPKDMFAYKNYINFNITSNPITWTVFKDDRQLNTHLKIRQFMHKIIENSTLIFLSISMYFIAQFVVDLKQEMKEEEEEKKKQIQEQKEKTD